MAVTTDKIRNIGLVGQRGAGKSTFAEAMAFSAGVTNRLGNISDGSTISDYTEEEKARQTSLNLSVLHFPWKGCKINCIDLPGHMDFIGDVLSGLAVVDSVLMIINAGSGVEVGTMQYFNHLERLNRPTLFVVNRLDKENTDFGTNIKALQEAFGSKAIPANLPIGKAEGFKGVIDLVKMKAVLYDDKGKQTIEDVPANMTAEAETARSKLMETVAESDDRLLEKFF